MSALREIFARFQVEVDSKAIEEADKKVSSFVGKLKEIGEVVAEAFAFEKIHEFVEQQVAAGAQLKIMSERLGTTTDELQAMQLAAGQAGVSSEALATGLRFLNRNISGAQDGGGKAGKAFKELGISVKDAQGKARPAGDVMRDFADAIAASEDPAKQTALAMQVLGRGGVQLLPLLKQGGKAFDDARLKMEELGGGLSEEFVEQAHEAEASQVRLNFALAGLKSRIAGALLPIVERAVAFFTNLSAKAIELTKHTNVLSTAVQFFGAVAALKATQSVIKLATEFGLLKPSILGTVRAMLGFAAPLLIIGALYLAYDELSTLLAGGDTLIGDALGPDKAAFVTQLRGAVDDLKGAFSDLGLILGTDGGAMSTFGAIIVDVAKAVAWLGTALDTIVHIISKIPEAGASFGIWLSRLGGNPDLGGSDTGLTPAAQERLASIGVAPDQSAPISALGQRNSRRTGYDDNLDRSARVPGDLGFVGPVQIPGNPGFVGPSQAAWQGPPALTVNNEIHIEGVDTNNATAVGDATGAGAATGVQRANDRALTKLQQP